MNKANYFENLDGLRFIAFLLVFLYHSFYTEYENILNNNYYHFFKFIVFHHGNLGVNFFFVLSGFLITYLLMEEKRIFGTINIKTFYLRRALRIWPLYFFCVVFGFFVFPALKSLFNQVSTETANFGYYLLFLSNFDIINNGLPDASMLGALWSIAIEEQFYLVWPVILLFFPNRYLWVPFAGVIISSLAFRAHHNSVLLNDLHTLSCISDMAVGGGGHG